MDGFVGDVVEVERVAYFDDVGEIVLKVFDGQPQEHVNHSRFDLEVSNKTISRFVI